MRVLPLGVAVVVALAGCGGSDEPLSKAEYEREMRAILAETSEADGSFEDGQEVLGDAVDEMDDLTPPRELAPAHEDYVVGLRSVHEDMDRLVEAERRRDVDVLLKLRSKIFRRDSVRRLEAARDGFRRAGVRLAEGFP
jgi:hypothetical protein